MSTAKLVSAADAMKETLLGTTVVPELSQQARSTFDVHARREGEDGDAYMLEDDFVSAIAPAGEDYHKIPRVQYGILFHVADRQKKGRVTLNDWANFQQLLTKPDSEYEIAFRLFDEEGTGMIKFENFIHLYNQNRGTNSIGFDWGGAWARLYVGDKRRRHDMTYPQFCQMVRGLQGEKIRQAFKNYDKDGDGYITPEEFQEIILETAKHKLSDHLLENLHTLCNISQGSKISYANVRAFQNVIREMDLLDLIVQNAARKSEDGKITRTDFLNEAARLTRFSQFTPMEADILFHFAGLDAPSGRLAWSDFQKVLDSTWRSPIAEDDDDGSVVKAKSRGQNFLAGLLESAHHFGLGSIAGAFGAFMVYPIDLVKTRMQNQRKTTSAGQQLYANSIDCARKVIRNEGIRGLYSGVLPQLVGVAPEKAIKLTVNDLVRDYFSEKSTGKIWWPAELLAGGSAGGCQVIFTNPLEIVKIKLQMQGELAKNPGGASAAPVEKRTAMWIVRNLGITGLYKGASACLLRDVPFSAIYFPTYNHIKRDFFGESPTKKLGILQLLAAAAAAGMPAAYLTTPADVIKTRLQTDARAGQTNYTGLTHAARTIFREEGFTAFFKGGPARILRSSPQFGFTLAAYEVLQRSFPLGHGTSADDVKAALGAVEPTIGLHEAKAPLPYLRSRNALRIILDLDSNFGRRPKAKDVVGWIPLPAHMKNGNGNGNGNGH